MRIDVFTLFPSWFDWMTESRPIANAVAGGHLHLRTIDMRAHTPLRGGRVDDAPYGGGAGMVIRVDVVAEALSATYGGAPEAARSGRRVIVLSPRGAPFTDAMARQLAEESELAILCGRYEAFDERVHTELASDVLSIGPYVLSGGEIAAMAIIDAVGRRLPGALGNDESLEHESFSPSLGGGAEHPHYTRPPDYRGWRVPEVLLSGHHGEVERWRSAAVTPVGSLPLEPGGEDRDRNGDADRDADGRAFGGDADGGTDPGTDHDPEADTG